MAGREDKDALFKTTQRPSVTLTLQSLMAVVDHHEAKVYRLDIAGDRPPVSDGRSNDAQYLLRHLSRTNQSREAGERIPEEEAFYREIASAFVGDGKIVVVGHGGAKNNAAHQLVEYVRVHHPGTYQRIARQLEVDLSTASISELITLARQALKPSSEGGY